MLRPFTSCCLTFPCADPSQAAASLSPALPSPKGTARAPGAACHSLALVAAAREAVQHDDGLDALPRLALAALRQWRGCTARGVLAVASLGPAAVFVILWSFFVCMTSPACALYAILSLVRASPQILLVFVLLLLNL